MLDEEDIKYLINRLESVIDLTQVNKHLAAARLLSVISLLKGQIEKDKTIKNQNNERVIYKNNPQEISIYKNGASGNLFFAKHCETARNRVIPKKVELDDRGVILVFN